MINISINGRLLDAIHAFVTSMTVGAQVAQVAPVAPVAPETAAVEKPVEKPETAPAAVEAPVEMPEAAPVVGLKTVEDLRGHLRQVATDKVTESVAAGRTRKKAAPREHVAVTRSDVPVEAPVETPVETSPEPIKAAEAPLAQVKTAEAPATKALAPVALDDEWPTTLTKPSSWDYDGQGASWRAANQIGTAELGAAIQRVYVDHADIIKMPSVRVAMSKLGVAGWWGCVAKNIADARDASNKPLDITPKSEPKND